MEIILKKLNDRSQAHVVCSVDTDGPRMTCSSSTVTELDDITRVVHGLGQV